MKKLLFIFAVTLLFSCDIDAETTAVTNDSTTHSIDTITTVVVVDTIKNLVDAKNLNGIFQTGFNNAIYTIAILTDTTYDMQIEKNKPGIRSNIERLHGNWIIENNQIILLNGADTTGKLGIEKDSLFIVQLQKNRAGSKIYMQRSPNAQYEDGLRQKLEKGLDVYALGNEPFWNAEIDNKGNTTFKLMDWDSSVVVKTVNPKINSDSTFYSFKGKENFKITIYNRFCNDGMSDRAYPKTVKVYYKNQTYNGCAIVKEKTGRH